MYNLILLVQNKNTKQYFKVVVDVATQQATVISASNVTANVSLKTVTNKYNIVELEIEKVTPLTETEFDTWVE